MWLRRSRTDCCSCTGRSVPLPQAAFPQEYVMPWESFEELAASYGLRQLRHPGCQTWAGSRFLSLTPLFAIQTSFCVSSLLPSVPSLIPFSFFRRTFLSTQCNNNSSFSFWGWPALYVPRCLAYRFIIPMHVCFPPILQVKRP